MALPVIDPIWHPSPNFGARRDNALPDMVVLHYTAMQDAPGALRALCNPETEVSAHYMIGRDGCIWQLVSENMRAWHAGRGAWGALCDVNSRSIGIEMCNTGSAPFSDLLMDALEGLLAGILTRWSIPPQRVIAHSDLAPGRKIDPGPRFDWRRLARQNLAIWPQNCAPQAPDAKVFCALCHQIGYTSDVDDATRLAAFRLRFRPAATGPLDAQDMGVAASVACEYPADRGGADASDAALPKG